MTDGPLFDIASNSETRSIEASPTLDLSNPDLFGAGNRLVSTGLLEESASGESFRGIYGGIGESGTSLFEADYHGFASLDDDSLRVEILAVDHNNASASRPA